MTRAVIAIVAYNSKTHWPRLKAALAAQTFRDFRVVVFDNASRAGERLTAGDMPANGALVQSETNLGFAAGNNRAFAGAEEPYLVCLNPDAFPEPEWLARLIALADAHGDAGAIGSLQVLAEDPRLLDGAGDCYWAGGLPYRALHRRVRPAALRRGEAFSACAAAALYRASAFREAGGFDESFFCYCEDVDLGFRLRLNGWRVLQADDAIVAHVGGASSGPRSAFAIRHGARNRIWTFVKNMPAPLLVLLAGPHAALTLFILLWSLVRGSAGANWSGVFAGLAGLPRILAARAHVQSTRRASSAAIAAALTWSPLAVLTRKAVRKARSTS